MPSKQHSSTLRVIVAVLTLVPAVTCLALQLSLTPDVELWLANHTRGFARPDAFDGVARIAPLFTGFFGFTSLLAAYLILSHRAQNVVFLAVGPCLGGLVYLAIYGVTDPAWFTLLALMSVGMLAATLVTLAWTLLHSEHEMLDGRSKSK